MGRRRIKIEKIECKEKLNVCFSKGRTGLFKKAKKLDDLSGSKTVIIIFSPAGKVFTFGDPVLDSLIDRYLLLHHHQPHRLNQCSVAIEDEYGKVDLNDSEGWMREIESLLMRGKENVMKRVLEQQQKQPAMPSSSCFQSALLPIESLSGISFYSSSSSLETFGVNGFENSVQLEQPESASAGVSSSSLGGFGAVGCEAKPERTELEFATGPVLQPDLFFDIDELLKTLSDPLTPEEPTDLNIDHHQQQQLGRGFQNVGILSESTAENPLEFPSYHRVLTPPLQSWGVNSSQESL
ncbi:PREDICTED: agamous-like MADS-box protein AGL23 [Nelumbo nucifera]|uniref:Agamous-like MADS-box protein AGL23 n=1 Tax=Nelumbo nucifera TaxID=4432 RepID=A0A1U7ZJG4_NELNU|nr:PREDICTED: agamous-like MADS-box protein AGL23 [Nelumbo nucifera]